MIGRYYCIGLALIIQDLEPYRVEFRQPHRIGRPSSIGMGVPWI